MNGQTENRKMQFVASSASARPLVQVAILDFGSQYSHLIARRVRELNVFCELHSCLITAEALFTQREVCGVILSGGSVTHQFCHPINNFNLHLQILDPVLYMMLTLPICMHPYGIILKSIIFQSLAFATECRRLLNILVVSYLHQKNANSDVRTFKSLPKL